MNIGFFSYLTACIGYLLLAILLFSSWRGKVEGALVIAASIVTAIWAGGLAVQPIVGAVSSLSSWTIEVIRSTVWLLFISQLLRNRLVGRQPGLAGFFRNSHYLIFSFAGIILIFIWVLPQFFSIAPELYLPNFQIFAQVAMAIFGLVLVEQFYRNTPTEQRWLIKYLCFSLGGMFAYDFYLYSDALLFSHINPDIWKARGVVVTLLAPLIAVSVARNRDWSVDIHISREFVFHTTTFVGAGIYLLIMATAGFYINTYGGEWGKFAQIVFLVGTIFLLALVLFSGQIRSQIRVFLSKHFFNYAYDYRQEWLQITSTLSGASSGVPLGERAIFALGNLVASPNGILWIQDKHGVYTMRANFGGPHIDFPKIHANDRLVEFIKDTGWVVNLDEINRVPELYSGLEIPTWLSNYKNAWLVVPLFQSEQLYGLILLAQSSTAITWNWEVIDLLKTAGKQAASYLALEDAAEELAEARQFEGFNRLSAFVIHDLKNIIAQLSLVVCNSERHLNNPEFMKDAISTVDHSVGKMSRLLSQLRNAKLADSKVVVDIDRILVEVVGSCSKRLPVPSYQASDGIIQVKADHDRLASTIEHIIQNAQDATGKTGKVKVRLESNQNKAIVEVEDNGVGMDVEFIRQRLFRPFDTTKGLTGMGIGAYESREYIKSIGGEIGVQSAVGEGTIFRFEIPLVSDIEAQELELGGTQV